MSKSHHDKKEFLKARDRERLPGVKNGSPEVKAQAETSRHPGGTRAKGLRKEMRGYPDYKQSKDRFGDAYARSSRLHRIKRWIKRAARAKGKTLFLQEVADAAAGAEKEKD